MHWRVAGSEAATASSLTGMPRAGATIRLKPSVIAELGAKKYQSITPITWFIRASVLGSRGVSALGVP